jgi:hypothetical protein
MGGRGNLTVETATGACAANEQTKDIRRAPLKEKRKPAIEQLPLPTAFSIGIEQVGPEQMVAGAMPMRLTPMPLRRP